MQLGYIADKKGGLDRVEEWANILAGGEKQRIAMARLFYHKPLFAILGTIILLKLIKISFIFTLFYLSIFKNLSFFLF